MANTDNLVQNQRRTPEERRASARRAGVKSGEARRKRKATRTLIKDILAMKPKAARKTVNALIKMGYDPEVEGAPTVEDLINIQIASNAMQGDLAAARFLYEYAQVPDLKAVLERERMAAQKEARARVDLNVGTAEEADALTEIRRMMANQAQTPAAGTP